MWDQTENVSSLVTSNCFLLKEHCDNFHYKKFSLVSASNLQKNWGISFGKTVQNGSLWAFLDFVCARFL